MNEMAKQWHMKLFKKSVLKQRKFNKIITYLGETNSVKCLDIGSDNGVISCLLRKRGGTWSSADLDIVAVESIRSLVGTNVYQIDGSKTPFKTNEYDKIVIVDFLEHISNEREFLREIYRILKPEGELIINVPHLNNSLLRRFRLAIGQTDEKHGHLRPGYTVSQIVDLLGSQFKVTSYETYSKFFSEVIDTFITFAYGLIKKEQDKTSLQTSEISKGVLVTSSDMVKNKRAFRFYSWIYPIVWLLSKLDELLILSKGYMLIIKTKSNKMTLNEVCSKAIAP